MESKITNSVKVSVTTEYDVKNSFPFDSRYVFRYTITIENLREEPIILLKRRWMIYDVGFGFSEVAGDGVIGLTPEIKSGESFSYFSNVILKSGVGSMSGVYTVQNLFSESFIEVEIPKFDLMSEVLCN